LDNTTGELAGKYANKFRKSHNTISLEDYLLAATSKRENALLWTGNTFSHVRNKILLKIK